MLLYGFQVEKRAGEALNANVIHNTALEQLGSQGNVAVLPIDAVQLVSDPLIYTKIEPSRYPQSFRAIGGNFVTLGCNASILL